MLIRNRPFIAVLAAFTFSLCLTVVTTKSYSQNIFKLGNLMVMENIAFAQTKSNVKKLLINDKWELSEEGTNNDLTFFYFKKKYWSDVIVYFTKSNKVFGVTAGASYHELAGEFAKNMKEQEFELLRTNTKDEEKIFTWGKKRYPFQFEANYPNKAVLLYTKEADSFIN